MIYPTEGQIIEYFAKLPTQIAHEFAPLLERAQREYRRLWQLEPLSEAKRIAVLSEFAAEVFKTRVAKRLREHDGHFEAFRTAISIDGGDAEMAFWYAHRLYNLVERGRMLYLWHREVEPYLWACLKEGENLWYTPELVPGGWASFLKPAIVNSATPLFDPQHTDAATRPGTSLPIPVANRTTSGAAADSMPNVRWEDLEIRFLSEERVQVSAPGRLETRNYAEMGFLDRRSGQPTLGWGALRLLAEHHGTISSGRQAGIKWAGVEKRVQEIRKRLRELHPAPGDPLPFINNDEHAGKVSGYEARFRIVCSPSYEA